MTAPDPFKEAKMHAGCFASSTGISGIIAACSQRLQAECKRHDDAGDLTKLGYWRKQMEAFNNSWAAVNRIADGKAAMTFEEFNQASRLADLLALPPLLGVRDAETAIYEFRENHRKEKESVFDKIDAAKEVLAVGALRTALKDFWDAHGNAILAGLKDADEKGAITTSDHDKALRLLIAPLQDLWRNPDSTAFLNLTADDKRPLFAVKQIPVFAMEEILRRLDGDLMEDGSKHGRACEAATNAFSKNVRPLVTQLKFCANYIQGLALAASA